jgi:hypothetical protein
MDVQVPVPETTKSRSVLITGSAGTDPEHLDPTIFDAARANGYLCLAVLERGDAMPVLQEMDGRPLSGRQCPARGIAIPGFRAGALGLFPPLSDMTG